MNEQSIRSAIEHLRFQRIAFEDGLANAEIVKAEGMLGFPFPPDLRQFLQTALPVSGGFPNWRSESEDKLRRLFDRPLRGILFDLEHNDFWPESWGRKPSKLENVVSSAKELFARVPPLIPIRYGHYIPSLPAADGNPVFAIRQSAVVVANRDLASFLTNAPVAAQENALSKEIRFWSMLARHAFKVPNLADQHVGKLGEYKSLRQTIEKAGYWAEIIPLFQKGIGLSCHRHKPERYGLFWVTKRAFGWLICIACPRFFFAPQENRLADLCVTLLARLPEENQRLPFGNFKLDDDIRHEFGLVAFDTLTDFDDEREAKLRSLEQLGGREMPRGQEDAGWDRYGKELENRSPQPSVTWDISPIYLRGKGYLEEMEIDLTLKTLAALQDCTRRGEELLVLDWNHPCFFFDPHGGLAGADPKSWAKPVLPNGDSCIFLAPDFRFGIIGA